MTNYKVKDIMSTNLITVSPDDSVYYAYNLLKENKIRQLPVCIDGKIVGIITDRDLRKIIGKTCNNDYEIIPVNLTMPIYDYMTLNPIIINEETPLEEAIQIINTKKFGSLPVCKSDKTLIGIVSITDISGLLLQLLQK